MSSTSLLLFLWSWFSFRVFRFALTHLVLFVGGFSSLFIYIYREGILFILQIVQMYYLLLLFIVCLSPNLSFFSKKMDNAQTCFGAAHQTLWVLLHTFWVSNGHCDAAHQALWFLLYTFWVCNEHFEDAHLHTLSPVKHIWVCNEHFGDAHLHTLSHVMHILVLHITHFQSYNAHFWVLLCTFWVYITNATCA